MGVVQHQAGGFDPREKAVEDRLGLHADAGLAAAALAGPATHLVWLAVLIIPWVLLREATGPLAWTISFLVRINITLMIFNLLPCFPMDGGRVLRSLLAQRMHPNKATMRACRVET